MTIPIQSSWKRCSNWYITTLGPKCDPNLIQKAVPAPYWNNQYSVWLKYRQYQYWPDMRPFLSELSLLDPILPDNTIKQDILSLSYGQYNHQSLTSRFALGLEANTLLDPHTRTHTHSHNTQLYTYSVYFNNKRKWTKQQQQQTSLRKSFQTPTHYSIINSVDISGPISRNISQFIFYPYF